MSTLGPTREDGPTHVFNDECEIYALGRVRGVQTQTCCLFLLGFVGFYTF